MTRYFFFSHPLMTVRQKQFTWLVSVAKHSLFRSFDILHVVKMMKGRERKQI